MENYTISSSPNFYPNPISTLAKEKEPGFTRKTGRSDLQKTESIFKVWEDD